MEISITKETNIDLMRKACEATIRSSSSMTLDKIYKCQHSPIRTQMYWIEMKNIPTFVSNHIVRHKIWVEHYVLSNRDDRGGAGNDNVTRNTLIDHCMWLNAEALITMCRKRLCYQASKETREIFKEIKKQIKEVDPELYKYLVPECQYRNGYCPELKPCGKMKIVNNTRKSIKEKSKLEEIIAWIKKKFQN